MSDATQSQTARRRCRITVHGRVQGVGFRPAFYRALTERGCAGSIRNTPEGVVIEAEADEAALRWLVEEFRRIAPERARVDELVVEQLEARGERGFRIEPSEAAGRSLLPIPPDLATCSECRAELAGGGDRRCRYPFNTCTACGPRFSIARQVPFDRATNSMDEFPPCERCSAEYADPADRRFHAQTISCPACGPSLSFLAPDGAELDEPLGRARRMLAEGAILAVKGVGGFHLACDATQQEVVARLRERKQRPSKPFAIMAPDLAACRRLCEVSDFEAELLASPEAPIVLLRRRPDCPVADAVAPGLRELGVMLPYAPLHLLLFEHAAMPPALVMTSCNRSEEPIAINAEHVLAELGDLVDGVLTHDREITNRCDDSVVAAFGEAVLPMRRSRGYVPEPVVLERGGPPLLATGGMMKNTFALTSGRRVFISQHIGDVSDADNAAYFARSFRAFSLLLRLEPELVVCDMHPDYPTTEFARELTARRGLPLVQVQQHHAHIASCLAEHGRGGPVIGVSWDGSGYGEDGAVWGGEFMVADRARYERRHHLEYVPLPGGEQAIVNPCRLAVAHLAHALGPEEARARMAPVMREGECELVLKVMEMPDFSPPTSSAGRLFDAASALLGVCLRTTYEGQAACELEARCEGEPDGSYAFDYDGDEIRLALLWRGICDDVDAGLGVGAVAAKFHATMARLIVETCRRLRGETGLRTVAMSGGVMQNRTLLGLAVPALEADGFEVLLQRRVPPNDAGLCLGQAACAFARLGGGDTDSH
jgi:hydrogenase maturation protein HypF